MKKNQNTGSILNVIGDFLSTFITALVIIAAVLLVLMKLCGWNMFSIDSSSMTPEYPVNTLVIVRDVEPEKIRTGDVITYVLNEDGVLVTHRVVDIDSQNRTFTTKGDANNTEDPAPVFWGNLVGKVVFGVPWIGKPMRVLTAKENRTAVIAILVILFVLSVIWDIVGRKKQKIGRSQRSGKEK